jgi:hypothetical protein
MRKLSIAAALAICTLGISSSAHAQRGGGLGIQSPAVTGIFHPAVGSGADYEWTKDDGTKNEFELSLVGKESVNGADGYWMEVTMQTPQMGDVTSKMLIVPTSQTTTIAKMVIQIPGRGAMSMPMNMMQGRGAAPPPEDIRNRASMVGSESVTVPAGTFTCDHWHMNDNSGDAWIATSVAPYGLVKMVSTKDKTTMVLVKTLTNVQDKITGPVMDMSQMMRGMGAPPQQ